MKIGDSIEISDARRIVDLRNLIIHGYDIIDSTIICGVILKDLPRLKVQVEKLMRE